MSRDALEVIRTRRALRAMTMTQPAVGAPPTWTGGRQRTRSRHRSASAAGCRSLGQAHAVHVGQAGVRDRRRDAAKQDPPGKPAKSSVASHRQTAPLGLQAAASVKLDPRPETAVFGTEPATRPRIPCCSVVDRYLRRLVQLTLVSLPNAVPSVPDRRSRTVVHPRMHGHSSAQLSDSPAGGRLSKEASRIVRRQDARV